MTERIDERLQAMGVDASGMTDEQKFTAATGLTRYTEYEANNAWYVPGGAANVPAGAAEPAGPTSTTEPAGPTSITEPEGPTSTTEPEGPTSTTEPEGPTSTTEPEGPTGESTGDITPTGATEATGPTGSTGEVIVDPTGE